MKFNFKYSGSSSVHNNSNSTGVSFAPDVLREPTYFVGSLDKKLPFREAISALHHVVTADFNFQPKDNTEYLAWLKSQEDLWLAEGTSRLKGIDTEINGLKEKLEGLRAQRDTITQPYYKAQRKYFRYLYLRDYTAWLVLDPVITVHPDQLFFECFSKDESVYGKLSCGYDVFKEVNEFKCGTTNIDYSKQLYNEFQKIRTYKQTDFKIDPSGFDVQTSGEDAYKEVKIDLPDSWVRGFLQVSTAMTQNKVSFDLHPIDIFNFISVLKRHKEKHGPRAIKYVLDPGKPIEAVFEPWNIKVVCSNSIFEGNEKHEVRVWGRRRITLLERLLPITSKFTVHLLGTGLPSFYIAHLSNDMYFTLGLSGWTANDWTKATSLDLLMSKARVPSTTMQRIYLELRKDWFNTPEKLSKAMSIESADIHQALRTFTQAGKVVYDLKNEVYRIRELKRDGIDLEDLKFTSEIDKEAYKLMSTGQVNKGNVDKSNGITSISARVSGKYDTIVKINQDMQIVDAKCTCSYYYQNKLNKGPCEHILATRLTYDNK